MKAWIGIGIIAVAAVSLGFQGDGVAQDARPVQIKVQGENTENALNLLRAGGFNAIEATEKFELPQIDIVGDEGVYAPGDIAMLGVDVRSKVPANMVKLTYRWVVIDGGAKRRFFTNGDGSSIAFGTGLTPRKILVMLDVNAQFGTKTTATIGGREQEVYTDIEAISPDFITTEVEIGGTGPAPVPPTPTPPPVPTPNPTPPPAPSFPEGKFGLAKFGYDTINNSALTKQQKAALGAALATNLEGIAAQIAALQNYRDITKILADTKAGNEAVFAPYGGGCSNS